MMDRYDLTGRTVLVTGGAGFVGSRIAKRLVGEGCGKIIVLDNLVRGSHENLKGIDPNVVRVVEGDIRDRELLTELTNGVDTVFHQAALRITHCAAEPAEAMQVMANATYDLFQTCLDAKVRKVIFAS